MSYSFVTHQGINENSGAFATLQLATPWTPSAGDHLFAVAGQTGSSGITIADGTNTYTLLGTFEDTSNAIYYSIFEANNVAGTSIQPTATRLGVSNMRFLYVREDSGLSSPAYIAGTLTVALAAAPGTGADAISTGGITLTAVPCALIGLCIGEGAASGPVAGSGFTSRGSVCTAAPSRGSTTEDQLVSSAGSPAVTYTAPSGEGGLDYVAIGAAFAIGSVAPAVSGPLPRQLYVMPRAAHRPSPTRKRWWWQNGILVPA